MHLDQFLLALFILLAVSAVAVIVSRRLGLGAVVGLIATGVLLGPSGFGLAQRVTELREVSELGIVFLLFLVGLEMQPQHLWARRHLIFGLGSAQVIVTGLALALFVVAARGAGWDAALILGFGLALSSTAFVLPMLQERGELDAPHGRATLAVLLLQDLAIVPLLALVPLFADQATSMGEGSFGHRLVLVALGLGAVLAAGGIALPALLHRLAARGNREGFALLTVAAVVGAAWVMLRVGLSMALGAFLIGVLLSRLPERHQIEAIVEPFKSVLMGLFFIGVGMLIDLSLLPAVGPLLFANLLALLAIKLAVLAALGVAFGLEPRAALRTGLWLAQAGEFAFVLFGAAAAAGILPPEGIAYAALVISLSMAATPLLARVADSLGR